MNKLIIETPVEIGILIKFYPSDTNTTFHVDECVKIEDGKYEITISKYEY